MPQTDTPVLLIIFNRPDKIRALIAALEKVRPTRIYVSADGPRNDVSNDQILCARARTELKNITWNCELLTNFSDKNLGCDRHVETAITWFFSNVDEGIILEDDCVPHPDFFPFASELLRRYQNDQSIMMISGNNFQDGQKHGVGTYYFSRYSNTWGWATWRRAWNKYDTHLKALPQFIKSSAIKRIRSQKIEQRYWLRYFDSLRTGRRSAWDAKWLFAIWNSDGICITPNTNLVSNIGFGADATHTKYENGLSRTASRLAWPLVHPKDKLMADQADLYLFRKIYYVSFFKRVWYKIRST